LNKNDYGFLKVLKNLKKKLIKKIGISIYDVEEIDKILKIFKPDIIQLPANIVDRRFLNENFLLKLKKKNINTS
jgi:aryl-alcohol dehydrogenase-like predicted oxidoreductase